VRQSLSEVDGVESVKVDFDAGTATCTVGPEVKDAQLTSTIPGQFRATVQ
jgi:copper chaperone CopZ